MIRGLYFNKYKHHKLLSIEEIASACHLSSHKVRQLIAANILPSAADDKAMVDATDLLWFLVRNNMVIPSSLLPPKTGKILFIGAKDAEIRNKELLIDHICRTFAESCSLVLTESCLAGPPADLTILTFAPHVAVFFLQNCDRRTSTTLDLLDQTPSVRTIVFVDNAMKMAIDNGLLNIPADLVISNSMPVEKLNGQLRALLTN